MSDPYLAEIRIFGYNFAPSGWAFCDGQILSIAQNTALFSLLGTTYGGNGQSTFALPNLQGIVPMGWGQGAGLTNRVLGETGGETSVVLTSSTAPAHTHPLQAFVGRGAANEGTPAAGSALAASQGGFAYLVGTNPATAMDPTAVGVYGSGQPHNNLMPYLALNFCIALNGVFPARN